VRNVLIRIAVWASTGFIVSLGWGLYFAMTRKGIPIEAAVSALAKLTQPAAGVILYIKPSLPLGLTWVAFANAATYALLGLIVETIRQHYQPIRISI
jgi:hypothetical protein